MENSATINSVVTEGGTINSTVVTGSTVQSTLTGGGIGPQGPQGIVGPQGPPGPTGTFPYFNVQNYGATGDGTHDDTIAIQDAIDAAALAGGTTFFPSGTYKITSTLTMQTGVSLLGEGSEASVIKQHTDNVDCLYGNDVASIDIQGLRLEGPHDSSTSGRGVNFIWTNAGNVPYISMRDVWVRWFGGTGVAIETPIVSHFDRVLFDANGQYGMDWYHAGTSCTFTSCWARNNVQAGYHFYESVYMALTGCAADGNGVGYLIENAQSIDLIACGAESQVIGAGIWDGTGMKISNSSVIGIHNAWFANNDAVALWITNGSQAVEVFGAADNSPAGGATAFVKTDVATNSTLSDIHNTTANSYSAGTVTVLNDGSNNLLTKQMQLKDASGSMFLTATSDGAGGQFSLQVDTTGILDIFGQGGQTLNVNLLDGYLQLSALTATTVPYLDANKRFASSAVTPTELGYVHGVTSAIQTQLNALLTSPMTTLGDIIYENSTPAAARLAGNTTTTKKFLTQTGNGTISAAPAWGTIDLSVDGGATILPIANGGTGSATQNFVAVFGVTAPTGVAATDTANIQAQITAASAAGGGTVQLQAGTYACTSSARKDTNCGYSSGHTITDPAAVSGDLGGYLIGADIQGRAPEITAVSVGTGYTVDIAPGETFSGATLYVVQPGVNLPDGIALQGVGAPHGPENALTGGTVLADSGTGITVLLRGGTNNGTYLSRSRFLNMAVWGNSAGTSAGNTLYGCYIATNSSFVEIDQCDISCHGTFGLATDWNQNQLDCKNTIFANNGKVGATAQSGGVSLDTSSYYSSANINFYNCVFYQNYGWGIAGAGFYADGGVAAFIDSCTFASTFSTSVGTGGTYNSSNSGVHVWLASSGDGISTCYNCWFESAGGSADVQVASGQVIFQGCNFMSTSAYGVIASDFTGCEAILIGCWSTGKTTATVFWGSGVDVTWIGCTFQETHFLHNGSNKNFSPSTRGFGTTAQIIVAQPTTVTVTANAGTVPVTATVANFTNSSAATMTITIATANAIDGQTITVRVYDFSAAAETIGWTNTENSAVTAPTTSNGSTTLPLTVVFIYNGSTSKWRCIQSV